MIGESAEPEVVGGIRDIFEADDRVLGINEIATLHMGPDFIVVTMSADFVDTLGADAVETAVTELNRQVKTVDPRIRRVFIEAEDAAEHNPAPVRG